MIFALLYQLACCLYTLTHKSQIEVGWPGTQGLQPQSHPKAEELQVTSTVRNPATSPRRKVPKAPVTQKSKGSVEINKPKKKDNNNTNNNDNNKIMTTNINKENNNRIPGKGTLR